MMIVDRKPRRIRRPILTVESCEARILMAIAPPLGVAGSFAALAGTTVTNTGPSHINGDVGVSPGTAITGFPPGVVTGGALHAGDSLAAQAQADLSTAYGVLAGEVPTTTFASTSLTGLVLTPGVNHFTAAAQLDGTLTFDAQGDPNAVFVVQVVSALTTQPNSQIVLTGGARASNVFWQVGSSATIGAGTSFQGNILAHTSVTLVGSTSIAPGRALAINGAVTMDTNNASTTQQLIITANDEGSVYGATPTAPTVTYSGFVNGDTPASLATQPTLTTAATAASHVGTYAITASGAVDPNYTITYVTGTLSVTPAPLTIAANDQSKAYGAALPTLTARYSGLVNGDTPASLSTQPTLATAATAASHVAGSPYAITAAGAVDPDYTISYVAGALTVTPAPLTIAANDQSKAYGAALPSLTARYSGLVNGDTSASLATPPALATAATAATHVAGSPYAITAAGASDGDYAITYAAGALTVTPVPLTITANDQSKAFGAALPTLTASYAGLVNGDTAATFGQGSNTAPTLTTTATASSPVSGNPYPIAVGGAGDSDYRISYAPGALTVTPSSVATSISGVVYLDTNAGGTRDAGETGLAGRVVFLDLNHDGILDGGDPTATTDAGGNFTLNGTSAGTGPVLEATDQDTYNRHVVDQAATDAGGTVTIGFVPISPIAPVKVVPNPFTPTPNADANTAYVQSLYHAVLGRTGADSEVSTWLVKMGAGLSRQGVATGFVNSPEHRLDQVNGYYEEFLGRAPDATSGSWVNALLSGVSEEKVVEGFLDSPEYRAAHQDTALFVRDLYIDVLGRQGEETGVAGWQSALASGTSREAVVAGFVHSVEASDQLVASFYAAFLHRAREVGSTPTPWRTILESADGSATAVASGILASREFEVDATTRQG